ncbi:desulfoferrodoxin, ferrous iron-binding domain [Gottschalkia purinilytica]|uniref:Desulfoferrodoxin, ferrous iron-binding domain n=1 Tax=Gottschalkia purinilytica TaxID=1503 RepID=A0A0L0W897_GOTPU|nr:class II SORL domain-containing protein [Gottschalkia purinilytica]KNF07774.1 desulfoferrodoxin, ferrous iron-binding domain [Gottschalkia purinilytica]
MSIGQFLQSGDWKGEKHVPAILAPEKASAGEEIEVKVSIGEEIKHPNTHEHHIAWVKVFFKPDDFKFPIEIGSYSFNAHGESDVFTEPVIVSKFIANKSGKIYALSYCNIHGLWENSKDLSVE